METRDLDDPGILLLIGTQSVRTIDGRGCFVSGRTKYETKTEVWFFKNILFSDLLDSLKALNISLFGKGYQQSDVLYNLQIYNCENRTQPSIYNRR